MCDHCEDGKPLKTLSKEIAAFIGVDNKLIIRVFTGGHYREYSIDIDKCPICGRRLR